MKLPKFKIRASAASKISGGTIGLTDTQKKKLYELENKPKDLTPLQATTLEGLLFKRDNPELPQTAKSYCEQWLTEQLYNRRYEFTSKYTDKGSIMEDWAIDFAAEQLDFGFLMKNTKKFENDYMTGEPDVITDDLVIDIKNPWSPFTFPLFDDVPPSEYYGQAQVYMKLTGIKRFKLVYTLSNTPESIIVGETIKHLRSGGYGHIEDNEDILKEFSERMRYDDVDDKLRIKSFDIDYDQGYIDELQERVKLCRKYIKEKLKMVKI